MELVHTIAVSVICALITSGILYAWAYRWLRVERHLLHIPKLEDALGRGREAHRTDAPTLTQYLTYRWCDWDERGRLVARSERVAEIRAQVRELERNPGPALLVLEGDAASGKTVLVSE